MYVKSTNEMNILVILCKFNIQNILNIYRKTKNSASIQIVIFQKFEFPTSVNFPKDQQNHPIK